MCNCKEIKKQRDKSCGDYLKLYNKIEETKKLIKDLIKSQKYKIENDKFIYIYLEELGDLREILYSLEK